jgi:hypothetical protein
MAKRKRNQKRKRGAANKWLLFIDTNILLDFYRQKGASAKRQLAQLTKRADSIITGDQVRMEFLNNRQAAILDGFKKLSKATRPDLGSIFVDYKAGAKLLKSYDTQGELLKKVQTKIEQVLRDPARHDQVYRSLNRIFDRKSPWNLRRPDKTRFAIRRLARKRFGLGYPPRKRGDTSIGDAINWEWIIHCATQSRERHNIIIVSRDSDYGSLHKDESVLNDWLRREFKDRVSRQRKIILTQKLTEALKKLNERVVEADVREENRLIADVPTVSASTAAFRLPDFQIGDEETRKKFLDAMERLLKTPVGKIQI